MPRHSKLQLQVLVLYKQLMRAARGKPGFEDHIREQFRKNKAIPRNDVLRIESLVRRGQHQLETLKGAGIQGMNVVKKDRDQ